MQTTSRSAATTQCRSMLRAPGWGYLSPLHYACDSGRLETVQFLLDTKNAGCDPNAIDACGWTPLHWAARGGHTDVCLLLIRYGAQKNTQDFVRINDIHYQNSQLRCDAQQQSIQFVPCLYYLLFPLPFFLHAESPHARHGCMHFPTTLVSAGFGSRCVCIYSCVFHEHTTLCVFPDRPEGSATKTHSTERFENESTMGSENDGGAQTKDAAALSSHCGKSSMCETTLSLHDDVNGNAHMIASTASTLDDDDVDSLRRSDSRSSSFQLSPSATESHLLRNNAAVSTAPQMASTRRKTRVGTIVAVLLSLLTVLCVLSLISRITLIVYSVSLPNATEHAAVSLSVFLATFVSFAAPAVAVFVLIGRFYLCCGLLLYSSIVEKQCFERFFGKKKHHTTEQVCGQTCENASLNLESPNNGTSGLKHCITSSSSKYSAFSSSTRYVKRTIRAVLCCFSGVLVFLAIVVFACIVISPIAVFTPLLFLLSTRLTNGLFSRVLRIYYQGNNALSKCRAHRFRCFFSCTSNNNWPASFLPDWRQTACYDQDIASCTASLSMTSTDHYEQGTACNNGWDSESGLSHGVESRGVNVHANRTSLIPAPYKTEPHQWKYEGSSGGMVADMRLHRTALAGIPEFQAFTDVVDDPVPTPDSSVRYIVKQQKAAGAWPLGVAGATNIGIPLCLAMPETSSLLPLTTSTVPAVSVLAYSYTTLSDNNHTTSQLHHDLQQPASRLNQCSTAVAAPPGLWLPHLKASGTSIVRGAISGKRPGTLGWAAALLDRLQHRVFRKSQNTLIQPNKALQLHPDFTRPGRYFDCSILEERVYEWFIQRLQRRHFELICAHWKLFPLSSKQGFKSNKTSVSTAPAFQVSSLFKAALPDRCQKPNTQKRHPTTDQIVFLSGDASHEKVARYGSVCRSTSSKYLSNVAAQQCIYPKRPNTLEASSACCLSSFSSDPSDNDATSTDSNLSLRTQNTYVRDARHLNGSAPSNLSIRSDTSLTTDPATDHCPTTGFDPVATDDEESGNSSSASSRSDLTEYSGSTLSSDTESSSNSSKASAGEVDSSAYDTEDCGSEDISNPCGDTERAFSHRKKLLVRKHEAFRGGDTRHCFLVSVFNTMCNCANLGPEIRQISIQDEGIHAGIPYNVVPFDSPPVTSYEVSTHRSECRRCSCGTPKRRRSKRRGLSHNATPRECRRCFEQKHTISSVSCVETKPQALRFHRFAEITAERYSIGTGFSDKDTQDFTSSLPDSHLSDKQRCDDDRRDCPHSSKRTVCCVAEPFQDNDTPFYEVPYAANSSSPIRKRVTPIKKGDTVLALWAICSALVASPECLGHLENVIDSNGLDSDDKRETGVLGNSTAAFSPDAVTFEDILNRFHAYTDEKEIRRALRNEKYFLIKMPCRWILSDLYLDLVRHVNDRALKEAGAILWRREFYKLSAYMDSTYSRITANWPIFYSPSTHLRTAENSSCVSLAFSLPGYQQPVPAVSECVERLPAWFKNLSDQTHQLHRRRSSCVVSRSSSFSVFTTEGVCKKDSLPTETASCEDDEASLSTSLNTARDPSRFSSQDTTFVAIRVSPRASAAVQQSTLTSNEQELGKMPERQTHNDTLHQQTRLMTSCSFHSSHKQHCVTSQIDTCKKDWLRGMCYANMGLGCLFYLLLMQFIVPLPPETVYNPFYLKFWRTSEVSTGFFQVLLCGFYAILCLNVNPFFFPFGWLYFSSSLITCFCLMFYLFLIPFLYSKHL